MSASIYFQSGQVVIDNNGNRAPGAKLYFFDANTTTPRNTYSDADLTAQRTHPVVADGNGRIPVIYLAYGSFDVKVTSSGGTQFFYHTDIANPAPFDDSTTFDTTTVLATGDIFFSLLNGTRTGAVRLNGRTIGNVTSSATERADEDTINLFAHLWNNLANAQAAVSGGRGASAAADFAASKRITLPDFRGCGPVGFDDMGNTAASLLGSAPIVTGGVTTTGSILGANTHTITQAQLPSHTHTFSATTGNDSPDHGHAVSITTGAESADHTHSISITSGTESADHTHDISHTTGTESADHTHNYGTAPNKTGTATGFGTLTGTIWNGTPDSSVATGNKSATHTHSFSGSSGGKSATHTHLVSGTSAGKSAIHTHLVAGNTLGASVNHAHSVSGTTGNGPGSGTAHNILARSGLVTWFIKL